MKVKELTQEQVNNFLNSGPGVKDYTHIVRWLKQYSPDLIYKDKTKQKCDQLFMDKDIPEDIMIILKLKDEPQKGVNMKVKDITQEQVDNFFHQIHGNKDYIDVKNWLADHAPKLMMQRNPNWMCKNRPEWTGHYYPKLMTKYNIEWMAGYKFQWMCEFQPDYMAEHHPELMVKYSSYWMCDRNSKYMSEHHPDIMFKHKPFWMIENNIQWVAKNEPQWVCDRGSEYMADHHPLIMVEHRPQWMVEHRLYYMADHHPLIVFQNNPNWMIENKLDWVEKYRPEAICDNKDVPKNILELLCKSKKDKTNEKNENDEIEDKLEKLKQSISEFCDTLGLTRLSSQINRVIEKCDLDDIEINVKIK